MGDPRVNLVDRAFDVEARKSYGWATLPTSERAKDGSTSQL